MGSEHRSDRRRVRGDHARRRVGEVPLATAWDVGAMSGAYIAALPVVPVFVASQTELDLGGLLVGAIRWRRLEGRYLPGAGDTAQGYLLFGEHADTDPSDGAESWSSSCGAVGRARRPARARRPRGRASLSRRATTTAPTATALPWQPPRVAEQREGEAMIAAGRRGARVEGCRRRVSCWRSRRSTGPG